MHVTPFEIDVPLRWGGEDGTIVVRARHVVAAERRDDNLPVLCYFRGGPGFEAPAPESRSGWVKEVLDRYRLVLLDQRGTGRSTPLDGTALPASSAADLAAYLRNFRADSIVRDAEAIRRELIGDNPWTIMGQSFGGFCTLTYLSQHPEGVAAVINTGGLAPIGHGPDEVYGALIERIAERDRQHYVGFPEDVRRVGRILAHIAEGSTVTGDGLPIISEQFRSLGELLGHKHGSAMLHTIIERADNDLDQLGQLSQWVTSRIADVMSVSTNPIYAVLHEAIYCEGQASRWSAQRAVATHPDFAVDATPPRFTGEMIFPWMFDVLPGLRPLKDAAHLLADYEQWPNLYDVAQLRRNVAPVVAAVYWNDLYVDRSFALNSADLVGNTSVWLTNEEEHRATTDAPEKMMRRLFDMLDDKIPPG